jgi:hypothetical protein
MNTNRKTIAIQIQGVAKIVSRAPHLGQNALPGLLIALQVRQVIAIVSAFHPVSPPGRKISQGLDTHAHAIHPGLTHNNPLLYRHL